jgi:hypothetical protein
MTLFSVLFTLLFFRLRLLTTGTKYLKMVIFEKKNEYLNNNIKITNPPLHGPFFEWEQKICVITYSYVLNISRVFLLDFLCVLFKDSD